MDEPDCVDGNGCVAIFDGADAGRFLTTIKRRLEEGAFEADLGL